LRYGATDFRRQSAETKASGIVTLFVLNLSLAKIT
jgi:hypothetical protein